MEGMALSRNFLCSSSRCRFFCFFPPLGSILSGKSEWWTAATETCAGHAGVREYASLLAKAFCLFDGKHQLFFQLLVALIGRQIQTVETAMEKIKSDSIRNGTHFTIWSTKRLSKRPCLRALQQQENLD